MEIPELFRTVEGLEVEHRDLQNSMQNENAYKQACPEMTIAMRRLTNFENKPEEAVSWERDIKILLTEYSQEIRRLKTNLRKEFCKGIKNILRTARIYHKVQSKSQSNNINIIRTKVR